jgi:hypothetical protein
MADDDDGGFDAGGDEPVDLDGETIFQNISFKEDCLNCMRWICR